MKNICIWTGLEIDVPNCVLCCLSGQMHKSCFRRKEALEKEQRTKNSIERLQENINKLKR